jgi:hypothetical protein
MLNDGILVSKKLGGRRLVYVKSIHNCGEYTPPKATARNRPHLARRQRHTDPPEPEAA